MPTRSCQPAWTSARRLSHVEGAADACHHWVGVRLEQIGGRHERVAHRLDFLEAIVGRDLFEFGDQTVETGDHLVRRVALAIGREPHEIAEQHGHVLDNVLAKCDCWS